MQAEIFCLFMIELTRSAAEEFKLLRQNDKASDLGIHIHFLYGCGGAGYRVTFESPPRILERVFESEGVRIYADGKSASDLEGARIDFQRGEFLLDHANAAIVDFC